MAGRRLRLTPSLVAGRRWWHLRVTHSLEAGRRWRHLTLTPTLMTGRHWRHLMLTLYPCGGTALTAFETNTSWGRTVLATFEGNPYPCGGTALAAFEVVTSTSKMAMPTGHYFQDSFLRGACGPDLSGVLEPPLAPQ